MKKWESALGVITSFGRNQTGLGDLTGSFWINEPTSVRVMKRVLDEATSVEMFSYLSENLKLFA